MFRIKVVMKFNRKMRPMELGVSKSSRRRRRKKKR